MRNILLQHYRAPGDVLAMTALVRDLQLNYPKQFNIYVDTSANEIWENNPHVKLIPKDNQITDLETYKLNYGPTLDLVASQNKHFLYGFYEDFERQTGIHVPLLYPKPDYHLSANEKQNTVVSGRYWVVISGGKSDFVTKHWVYKRHQQVVNLLKQAGIHCVQIGAVGGNDKLYHFHPRLENTLCLVGLTSLRDIAQLIYHAEGVICSITVAMHLAAALDKPAVVIAGGREEWWWAGYVPKIGNFGKEIKAEVTVPHRFLHTLGLLDCCKTRGCWRNTITPSDRQCVKLLDIGGQAVPRCMDIITPNHVIEAVMSYYEDGTLPPVGQPKPIALIDGRFRVLHPNENLPIKQNSSLAEALTLPEPQLLTQTAGMRSLHVVK